MPVMRSHRQWILKIGLFSLECFLLFLPAATPAQRITASTDPAGISAVAVQGTSTANQTFKVRIEGGAGIMLYSIFTDQPWFAVSPEDGQTEGEMDVINVMFYPETLNVGEHLGNITIMGTFCTNQPFSIPVSLTVVTNTKASRSVRVPPDVTGTSGYRVSIPVHLISTGGVSAVAFSLNFNRSDFSLPCVVAGTNALDCSFVTNGDRTAWGQIGVQIAKPPSETFEVGTSEVAIVSILVNSTTVPGKYAITFTNTPIICSLANAEAYPLVGAWPKGTVQITAGYEADVSPRPNGKNDGTIVLTDWVQVGRFAANLDSPTTTSEFRRADCAPRDIRGDGILTVADWVQAGRYYSGIDPIQRAGGPMVKATNTSFFGSSVHSGSVLAGSTIGVRTLAFANPTNRESGSKAPIHKLDLTGNRQLSVQNSALPKGSTGTVSVTLQALGNENALGFSAKFNPTILRFVGLQSGPDAVGATVFTNTRLLLQGELGIAFALPAGQCLKAGSRDLVRLRFEAACGAPTLTTTIDLTDTPIRREISSSTALRLDATYYGASSIVLIAQTDNTGPILTVIAPSPAAYFRTPESSLAISGTAADASGIIRVSWSNNNGASGACVGTTNWTSGGIPLSLGSNSITVQAVDRANNLGLKIMTVVSIPMTFAEASADSDGDGLSNWQEALIGTDSRNANSCFRLVLSAPKSLSDPLLGVDLSWSSTPGLSYSVWRSPSPAGPFAPLAPAVIATGWKTTYLDTTTGSSAHFFYSVRMDTP